MRREFRCGYLTIRQFDKRISVRRRKRVPMLTSFQTGLEHVSTMNLASQLSEQRADIVRKTGKNRKVGFNQDLIAVNNEMKMEQRFWEKICFAFSFLCFNYLSAHRVPRFPLERFLCALALFRIALGIFLAQWPFSCNRTQNCVSLPSETSRQKLKSKFCSIFNLFD